MSYLEAVRAALGALRVNPTRSVLTMLGVIIGVAAVILVVAIGSGARELVVERIRSLGANLLIVEPGAVTNNGVHIADSSSSRLTEDDAAAIQREIPGVIVAVPMVRAGVQTVRGARNWPTQLYGTAPGFMEAREWSVVAGRELEDEDFSAGRLTAMIGQTLASQLFEGEDPIGASIRIQGTPFTVVGLLARKGQTTSGKDQDDVAVIPLRTAKRRVLGTNAANDRAIDTMLVKIDDADNTAAAEAEMTDLLRARHRRAAEQDDDFAVKNMAEVLKIKDASTRAFANLVASIALISLLVGGIGIMNIMLVSVLERTREIGIRIAVGARRRDILAQFLIESATLSFTGGMIGLVLGIAGTLAAAAVAGWPAIVSPAAIGLALSSSLAVGVLFGFYPAERAAALDPIEALRRE